MPSIHAYNFVPHKCAIACSYPLAKTFPGQELEYVDDGDVMCDYVAVSFPIPLAFDANHVDSKPVCGVGLVSTH